MSAAHPIDEHIQTECPNCAACSRWQASQRADFDRVMALLDAYADECHESGAAAGSEAERAARDALVQEIAGLYPADRADA